MKLREQAEVWFSQLGVRKLRPVKPGTLRTYRSLLDARILPRLGDAELETFKNLAMKNFVSDLAESGLAVSTQSDIVAVVKEVIASAVNEEGEFLYPRTWNSGYIDAPQVVIADRRTPAATSEQVRKASQEPFGAFWTFLGGTGLRIGEARAVRYGDNGVGSAWDPERGVVSVRTQFYRGLEQPPKTPAAIREVDLPPNLNNYLKERVSVAPGSLLFGGSETLWRERLARTGIQGFHAFRRYRVTHLRATGAPEDLLRFWVGHSAENVTDRYSKLAQNVEFRKEWAEKIGVGFKLGDYNVTR